MSWLANKSISFFLKFYDLIFCVRTLKEYSFLQDVPLNCKLISRDKTINRISYLPTPWVGNSSRRRACVYLTILRLAAGNRLIKYSSLRLSKAESNAMSTNWAKIQKYRNTILKRKSYTHNGLKKSFKLCRSFANARHDRLGKRHAQSPTQGTHK